MTLQDLRRQIDALDKELLTKLAERMKLAAATKGMKEKVEDAERETQLRAAWKEITAEEELNEQFTKALLDLVLEESKRLQRDA